MHEAGLRCLEDVAIVGFDDIEEGRFSSSSLASISPDKDWIARTALDRLVRRLSGETLGAATIIALHRLVIRESSAADTHCYIGVSDGGEEKSKVSTTR